MGGGRGPDNVGQGDREPDRAAQATEILFTGPDSIHVVVKDGVVVLTGRPGEPDRPDLIPVAEMLTWGIDGVVDVLNRLTAPNPAERPPDSCGHRGPARPDPDGDRVLCRSCGG